MNEPDYEWRELGEPKYTRAEALEMFKQERRKSKVLTRNQRKKRNRKNKLKSKSRKNNH